MPAVSAYERTEDLRVGELGICYIDEVYAHVDDALLDPLAFIDVIRTVEIPLRTGEVLIEHTEDGWLVNGVMTNGLCRKICHNFVY